MALQALAAAATLLAVTPHGNQYELKLDRGSAEMVWLSPGAFRFRRVLQGDLPKVDSTEREPSGVRVEDAAGQVTLRTRSLEVILFKQDLRIEVRQVGGGVLLRDVSAQRSEAGGVTWEREAPAGA